MRSEFEVREIIDGVPFSGRTDPAISHDLLAVHGLEPSSANILRLKSAYLRALPDSPKPSTASCCPAFVPCSNACAMRTASRSGCLPATFGKGPPEAEPF